MIESLRSELIGYEMSMIDLDNKMVEFGFQSVYDEGTEENIVNDCNGVWTSEKLQVQIHLKGNLDNLVVTEINEF